MDHDLSVGHHIKVGVERRVPSLCINNSALVDRTVVTHGGLEIGIKRNARSWIASPRAQDVLDSTICGETERPRWIRIAVAVDVGIGTGMRAINKDLIIQLPPETTSYIKGVCD